MSARPTPCVLRIHSSKLCGGATAPPAAAAADVSSGRSTATQGSSCATSSQLDSSTADEAGYRGGEGEYHGRLFDERMVSVDAAGCEAAVAEVVIAADHALESAAGEVPDVALAAQDAVVNGERVEALSIRHLLLEPVGHAPLRPAHRTAQCVTVSIGEGSS